MRTHTIDQLALLPEELAVGKHFDRLNYRIFRWIWRVSAVTSFVLFATSASNGDFARVAIATLWMVVLFALYALREREKFEQHFAEILSGFLLFCWASLLMLSSEHSFRIALSAAMMPMLFVFLRLPRRYYVLISSIFIATAATLAVTNAGIAKVDLGEAFFMPLTSNALFVGVALYLNRRERIAFLKEWSVVASRAIESERMRGELADARKIQLAMLPSSAPAAPWLDVSSISLPASEVGGDFYDYFTLEGGRVVIAIGDVAGHGVSSGLVLAGIKSGLHLLRDELSNPTVVIERLNRLASEWLQWRMLVTLLIGVIDPVTRRLRVVSAGHPPVLVVRPDTPARRVGKPALPLGTKLAAHWDEDECDFAPGDALIFYTDGLSELANRAGEAFGDERLVAVAQSVATSAGNADEIRDLILMELSRFKDGAQQADDLSFVVARIREL